MNSQEVIARELCSLFKIDPDGISTSGEPHVFHLRKQALAIELALLHHGFEIVLMGPAYFATRADDDGIED
jgi:hypothetical protein